MTAQQRVRLDWFPFYARDWSSDMTVRMMTAAERGYYVSLLAAQWMEGGLPDDVRQLTVLAMSMDAEEFGAAWVTLEPLFPTGSDGLRRNPRLDKVANAQQSKARQRKKIAKDAANTRWAGVSEQKAEQTANAEWAQAEHWLADQTTSKRKAVQAKARKQLAKDHDTADMGDGIKRRLEKAITVTILRDMGVLNNG